MKKTLKIILFIVLNLVVLGASYIPLQCIIAGPWTISIWIVALLALFFVPYSFITLEKPSKKRVGIMLLVVIVIILITQNSDSIQLASDKDMCWDFGGRWNYEKNKCEESRIESLNQ
ncbi:MAG: hypothetical protein GY793_04155 [Proteobacteria bacterium]|nr:hypothetical protein [Pseudomonadota bacterium]